MDPNGPMSLCVPPDESIGQPRGMPGVAEYLLGRQHLKERNVVHMIGK